MRSISAPISCLFAGVCAGAVAGLPLANAQGATQQRHQHHAHRSSRLPHRSHTKKQAAAPPGPLYGTIRLSGTASADNTITMQGALSLGHVSNLDWDLPLVSSFDINDRSQHVASVSFAFNVAPDSFSDVAIPGGNTVRRFHWNAPPAATVIHVTETVHVTTYVTLDPMAATDAPFPLAAVPAEVTPELEQTVNTTLPAGASAIVSSLTSGQRSEAAVVSAIQDYVVSHTHYQSPASGPVTDAGSVWQTHSTDCNGYDNLMSGMLRAAHIPVRTVVGWVSSAPLVIPGPYGGSMRITWGVPGGPGELHSWLQVWFPGPGWVAFDPQMEKFFVDPRHIPFYTNADAGQPLDSSGNQWYGMASGDEDDAGDPLFGDPLPNGGQVTVPGDGSGAVSVSTVDHMNVRYAGYTHDVNGILLFSR